MTPAPDVLGAVVAALARVLERDAGGFDIELALDDLGVDSLVRVEVAELVEEALGGSVWISDERLDEASTVGALAAGFVATARLSAGSTTPTGGDA